MDMYKAYALPNFKFESYMNPLPLYSNKYRLKTWTPYIFKYVVGELYPNS